MFEKLAKFCKSQPGIMLLFVCSIFMLALTTATLIKNAEQISEVIYLCISGFAMSALGVLIGIKRMRDLKAER
ncbi:MAG TPA: hypothetical protein VL093_12405 [Flavipsychrobacter sp.]|nr:hypothetical protein [Flavipsychrobacter sp.]